MQAETPNVEHQDNPAPPEIVSLHQMLLVLPTEQPNGNFQASCFTTVIPTPKVHSIE